LLADAHAVCLSFFNSAGFKAMLLPHAVTVMAQSAGWIARLTFIYFH
jgi:hypothetical protein